MDVPLSRPSKAGLRMFTDTPQPVGKITVIMAREQRTHSTFELIMSKAAPVQQTEAPSHTVFSLTAFAGRAECNCNSENKEHSSRTSLYLDRLHKDKSKIGNKNSLGNGRPRADKRVEERMGHTVTAKVGREDVSLHKRLTRNALLSS